VSHISKDDEITHNEKLLIRDLEKQKTNR